MIRWAGLSSLAIMCILFVLITWVFTDQWFEETIEESTSLINRAKVEIDDFHISFMKMQVNWKRMQVTDPKSTLKNRLETGYSSFDLEFWPLLSNKYIINELIIDSIKFNTDRNSDGKLDSTYFEKSIISDAIDLIKSESSEFITERKEETSNNLEKETLIPKLNIKSIDRIKDLQNSIDSSTTALKTQINSAKLDKRYENLKTTVNQISIQNMKNITQIKSAIDAMSSANKQINEFKSDYGNLKQTTETTLKQLNSAKQIDDWISEDYKSALKLAKLPDFSVGTMAKTLFGSQVYLQYLEYLEYFKLYEEYSAYFNSEKIEKEKSPPRLKGQTIHFYKKTAEPDFWVKKINLSILLEDGSFFAGVAKNLVSDQVQVHKTTTFDLFGKSLKGAEISIYANFNHLAESGRDTIRFQIKQFPIRNYKLSRSDLFPEFIKSATGDIKIDLIKLADKISGTSSIDANQVVYQFNESSQSKTKTIIKDIFAGINELQVLADLTINNGKPEVKIRSNLDNAVANGLKQSANKELDKLKLEIRKKLEDEIGPTRNSYLKKVGVSQADINLIMDQLDGKKGALDQLYVGKKKYLNDKIETEKKKLGFLGSGLLKGLKIN